ncbi:hypothetical protein EW026_g6039 [Hermanssonia centrifuga]|uniref:Uncharacterized protein n=2 Tax=Hermanssonia centrifuga TaxID=98765 RepID=A0A2R6RIC3_9APHY|nr:hypothetical protein PHLCEN_2v2925 [Hermanssonia centrifuga]THG95656.1 hypothetical protein EW026_g6039 [Hermanssonia centrifuga]
MANFDPHVRRGHPIVFGLLILFAIIELALSAWLTSRYNAHHNFPSTGVRDRTRFLLFTSIWTVFFSFLYMILFLHSASSGSVLTSVGSHGIFLFITWVFWIAGSAAITAALGGGLNCGRDPINYCDQLNALEAFGWIETVLTTFAILIVMFRGISASRRGDGLRGQLVSV